MPGAPGRAWVSWVVGASALIVLAVLLVKITDEDVTRVSMVGDSVTYLSTPYIGEALSWIDRVAVKGHPGYRTDQLVPVAEEQVADDPDVLVLLTGYNDVLQEHDPEAGLRDLVDVVSEVPCVVWMLVPVKGDYDPARMEAYNARLEELTRSVPTIHLSPLWRDVVDATEGPDPDPELISNDRVHPLGAGGEALARSVDRAVRDLCPQG